MARRDDWREIDDWLCDLYGSSNVPAFKRTTETRDALHQLYCQNKVMNTVLERGREALLQLDAAQDVVPPTHIDTSMLSLAGQQDLDHLSLLAVKLGIQHGEISSYRSAIAQLTMESMDAILEKDELDDVLNVLDKRAEAAEEEHQRMQELLSNMKAQRTKDQSIIRAWNDDTDHISKRIMHLHKVEKENEEAKADQHRLRLAELSTFDDQLLGLESKLNDTRAKLEDYHDLPANIEFASHKYRKCQEELAGLEKERERLLAQMAQSFH